jgi:hypothetical protein
LLDKSIIRRILNALWRLYQDEELFLEETISLAAFERLLQNSPGTIYISEATENILKRLPNIPQTALLLRELKPMKPSKYFRRWARRLRGLGYTREDAKLLSLGTFGMYEERLVEGCTIITYDLRLINKHKFDHDRIQAELKKMKGGLKPPYSTVGLPKVVAPESML